ncbi:O-antigen ligase family protein [Romboutsia timonensis]|uniref:O-antigen ligase family protein n=1 Tax=Romboutsia timonensis TaxID=1776391 RepID=UPI002A7F3C4F|nr:O-antigen ligase family protein [Romboutsia timonensis]MDY3959066.1 O-antigen ligase family protein [Romboutsia timonensis]
MSSIIYTLKILIELSLIVITFVFSLKRFLGSHKLYSISQILLITYIVYIVTNAIVITGFQPVTLQWLIRLITFYMVVYNFVKYDRQEDDFHIEYFYTNLSILHAILWIISMFNIEYSFAFSYDRSFARLGGIIIHPSTLSIMSGMLIIIGIYFKFYKKRDENIDILNIILGIVSLIQTYGRVGICIVLIMSFIYIFRYMRRYTKYIIVSIAPLLIIFILFVLITNNNIIEQMIYIVSRGKGITDIVSLNGRKDMWIYFISDILQSDRILMGYGFNTIENIIQLSGQSFSEYAVSTENAYINILLELGSIGITIYTLIITCYFIEFKKGYLKTELNKQRYILNNIIMIILLIDALFLPSFGGLPRLHTFLLMYTLMINTKYYSQKN